MAHDGPPAKILLVDDSVEMLDLLEVYLAGEGFDLTATHSGDEALLAARRTKPDLIILDVVMPGMDGYEVCEKLQAHKRPSPTSR